MSPDICSIINDHYSTGQKKNLQCGKGICVFVFSTARKSDGMKDGVILNQVLYSRNRCSKHAAAMASPPLEMKEKGKGCSWPHVSAYPAPVLVPVGHLLPVLPLHHLQTQRLNLLPLSLSVSPVLLGLHLALAPSPNISTGPSCREGDRGADKGWPTTLKGLHYCSATNSVYIPELRAWTCIHAHPGQTEKMAHKINPFKGVKRTCNIYGHLYHRRSPPGTRQDAFFHAPVQNTDKHRKGKNNSYAHCLHQNTRRVSSGISIISKPQSTHSGSRTYVHIDGVVWVVV